MAYNPYYPASYQQVYQPYQQQSTPSIQWVQGVEGAKAYPVTAGSSVLLMDSESSYMYIKSADQAGMPTMRVYEYKEVTSQPVEEKIDMSGYVTKEELEKRLAELTKKSKKKESDDE